ncbi:MAG: L,D-transpeptidase, partial [Bifidobacteriaceae bacterium]|nr:L,D-transpeptidase [Bifidobacteriaceae bacterium]
MDSAELPGGDPGAIETGAGSQQAALTADNAATSEEDRPNRWKRSILAILAVFTLVAALTGGTWIGSTLAPSADAPEPPVEKVTVPALGSAKTEPPAPVADGPYPIAHLPGDVPAYAEPGGEVIGTVAGSWWGYDSKLPILQRRDGFLLVRLQQRPNESTTWISAEGITITETPYRIEVDLTTHRVRLYNLGQLEMDIPAIIGRPATPTPAGHYFVTMLQPGPSASYGKRVLILSAHSETIDNWQGSGDAVTAIHGPLGNEGSV